LHDVWLLVVFVLAGAGSWLIEHQGQKDARYRGLAVCPPRAVAWLCGHPRRDGTIDLDAGVRQVAALAFVLAAPLVFLLPVDLSRRAGLIFLAYAIISVPGFFLGQWARWRVSHALARKLDVAKQQPGTLADLR